MLRPEPIALRPAKDARPRAARTRRESICLSPHRQGRKSRPAVRALPPAPIRPACQQPLSPPPRRQLPARQQTRKGRAQSRRLHTQGHSTLGSDVKCCTAPVNDLKRKDLRAKKTTRPKPRRVPIKLLQAFTAPRSQTSSRDTLPLLRCRLPNRNPSPSRHRTVFPECPARG